jgi:hypothetical protein
VWEGSLQILVTHPAAEGARAASLRALAVRNHFPRALTLVQGQARVLVLSRSIQPVMQAIDWLTYPVLIGWYCEEIPS